MKHALPLKAKERHELRKHSFDASAALYHRARPGYPEKLFDDLVRLSRIPEGGRILEIGPGTGKATLPLARRGFAITGIELGAKMARFCRRTLRGFPRVEIHNIAFEDWAVEPQRFDLVFSATAFHWIPARTAFPRAAQALRPEGSLALAWNFRQTPDDDFHRELREVYHRLGLNIARARPPEERIERQRKAILNSGRFGPVTVVHYPWQRSYTAGEYIDLLRTMSDHATLPPATKRRLFDALRRLFERHSGKFTRPVVACLLLAPLRRPKH